MLWFQVVATIFILFALGRITGRYKEARIPKSEVLVWVVFWILIAGAVWWPRGTDLLAQALGISRGYELVVAISLALLFSISFTLFSHVHQLQSQVTKLVRQLALQQPQSPHSMQKELPIEKDKNV